MKNSWNEITREDVIKAIEVFDSEQSEYPEARSTFLLYKSKKYPAKHIRGMAYKIHFGEEISKADYSGGAESVRFFDRLGFEVRYVHKNVNTHPKRARKVYSDKADIRVGLYLQTYGFQNKRCFEIAMEQVKKSDIDILVLPECSYVPFEDEMERSDFLNEMQADHLFNKALSLSEEIGKAVVFCGKDINGIIMSFYANAFAQGSDTVKKSYIKHTMTDYSACELKNYSEYIKNAFEPIIYKGWRIGHTICYDCNHAMFSRKYGLNGVDIILNSTGGDVIYDKWNKYNKARSIENHCFSFVTMGGFDGDNTHNYVFGFTPEGKEMPLRLIDGSRPENRNTSGAVYVYDTSDYDGTTEEDQSVNQKEKPNKYQTLFIKENAVAEFSAQGKAVAHNIRVFTHNDENIVLCMVDGADIMKPEKVLPLLYDYRLKGIKNKRYIIINHWSELGEYFYMTKLSLILKVRSMENYCAVILDSPSVKKCFQCGKNRTAQVVRSENGEFGIDLSRTSGPEAIWKNKPGMKACWRNNIEYLIGTMTAPEI